MDILFTIDCWRVVHFSCKSVEYMNEAISWRDTRLSEVLMMKLDCVCDGNQFCLGIYSSLAAIMVERSTGAETISSSIIPLFASAWIVVNN